MKNLHVHYKNKFPGGRIFESESSIDVYDADGNHAVAIRKNGAGQWVCASAEFGCSDRHDLAPIPKDSRVFKVTDGKISKDEKAAEREQKRSQFMNGGKKVLSCADLKSHGWEFDDRQEVRKAPEAPAAPEESEG